MIDVLVVDDERDFADILSQRLTTRGMNVHTAYDGASALDMLHETDPDVVVLDVSMPGMDGLATLGAIKERNPRAEVILLTADSTVDTAVTGMKLGAVDYLVKPTDIDTLVSAIKNAQANAMESLARRRMSETAKLVALGEMAKGVAHEINNPVHIMRNEAGWIKDLLDEEELRTNVHHGELRNALSRIEEQADRCKAVTAKLLTLRCSLDTRIPETNVPELVEQLLDQQKDRLHRLGIRTTVRFPPELPLLHAPQSEWEQVLGNLIENALDAMAEHGGELRIAATLTPSEVTLRVEDTGCGIEAHLLTRIFEPFFSTKDVGAGTGLGLAICHGIVEAMGGNISVQSTPGAGSVFTIRVPLDARARTEQKTSAHEPALTKEATHE